MEEMDVVRLGLILAIQAEIEGMKACNNRWRFENAPPNYSQEDFQSKADELRKISRCHRDQL